MDIQELKTFLVKAKVATYAAGDAVQVTKEADGSKTLIFEEGDWKYHDNYFGGEPYGGREVVFYKGSPAYMMVYYGLVDSAVVDFEPVYKVLQSALRNIPADKPYRGPVEQIEGGFVYSNSFTGEVDNFSGEETISEEGKIIYSAKYIGGLIDQKK